MALSLIQGILRASPEPGELGGTAIGNIVIANMQASLTLDTHQFEDAATRAEERIAAFEKRGQGGPTDPGRPNVGEGNGPVEQARQAQALQRAQEVQAAVDAATRISTAAQEGATSEEGALRKRTNSFAVWAQAETEVYGKLNSAADVYLSKLERIATLSAATAQRAIAGPDAPLPAHIEQPTRATLPAQAAQTAQVGQPERATQPTLRTMLHDLAIAEPPAPELMETRRPVSFREEIFDAQAREAMPGPFPQREIDALPRYVPAAPSVLSTRPAEPAEQQVVQPAVRRVAQQVAEPVPFEPVRTPVAFAPVTHIPARQVAEPEPEPGEYIDPEVALQEAMQRKTAQRLADMAQALPTPLPTQGAQEPQEPQEPRATTSPYIPRLPEPEFIGPQLPTTPATPVAPAPTAVTPVAPAAQAPAAQPDIAIPLNIRNPQYTGPGSLQAAQFGARADLTSKEDLPDEVKRRIQGIVAGNAEDYDAQYSKVGDLVKEIGRNDLSYKALQFATEYQGVYAKQNTPAAIQRRQLADIQAQVRDVQGVPQDPVERAQQRLERARAKAEKQNMPDPDDEDTLPGEREDSPFFPWLRGAHRGHTEALSYQRYQALQTGPFAYASSFLQGAGAPGATNALAALAGPELAAAAAATALGLALKTATDATIAYSDQQFKLTSTLAVTGTGEAAVDDKTRELIERLTSGAARQAISPQDMRAGLIRGLGEGLTPQGLEALSPMAVALQHAGDMKYAEAMEAFANLAKGGSAAPFAAISGGKLVDQSTLPEVLRVLQPMLAADTGFAATPSGKLGGLGAWFSGVPEAVGKAINDYLTENPAQPQPQGSAQPPAPAIISPAYWQTQVPQVAQTPTAQPYAPTMSMAGLGAVIPGMPTVPGVPGIPSLPGAPGTQPSMTEYPWNIARPQPGPMPAAGEPLRLGMLPGQPVTLPAQRPLIEQGAPLPGVGAGLVDKTGDVSAFTDPTQYAQGALAQITAMRQVSEEVASSEAAVSGIQKVFSNLTMYHVEWREVQPQLDNLEASIIELQKWWVKVANSRESGITEIQYRVTKDWLDVTNGIVSLMGTASDSFAKVYENTGKMPSQGQRDALVSQLRQSFGIVADIATRAFEGNGTGERDLLVARVKAWSDAMGSTVNILSGGSDALAKIYTLPLPEPARTQEVAQRIASLVSGMDKALIDAFTQYGGVNEQGQDIAGTFIDSKLGTAGQMAENVNKMVSLAGNGADTLRRMTNLYVPTPDEIKKVVERTLSIGSTIATEMEDALRKQHQAADAASPPGGIGPVRPGAGDDPTLKAAGERADNLNKMMGLMSSGVGALRGMTNLYVPTPGEITRVVTGVFNVLDDAMAQLPAHDADAEGKARAWGEALGPLAAVMSSGVGTLRGMTNLYVPSPGEINRVVTGIFGVIDGALANLPAWDPQQAAQVQMRGEALGAVVGFMSGGVQTLRGMTNLYVPTPTEIAHIVSGIFGVVDGALANLPAFDPQQAAQVQMRGEALQSVIGFMGGGVSALAAMRNLSVPDPSQIQAVVRGTFGLVSGALADMPMFDPQQADKVKQNGEAMSAVMGVLSGGVGVLAGMRNLAEPSDSQMSNFRQHIINLSSMFSGIDQSLNPEQASRVKDWGDSMGAMFGGLSTGAVALAGIRDARLPSPDELGRFKESMTTMLGEVMPTVLSTSQAATDRARDWGTGMTAVFQAASASADVIAKIRDIRDPSKEVAADFLTTTQTLSDSFIQAANKYGPEMLLEADKYGDTLGKVMGALLQSSSFLGDLPSVATLPKQMIDDYFDNVDDVVVDFRIRAEQWVKDMSLENAKYAKDVGDEMEGLTKAADLFNKIGLVRVNYTGNINMFFNNLDHFLVAFDASATRYKGLLSENTRHVAQDMQVEFEAIDKALDPMTKLEEAARAQPGMIPLVFRNLRLTLEQFAGLADAPELQGDKLANLQRFSAQMDGIFGSIKNATDAAQTLNTPQGMVGGGDFRTVMEAFFMHNVPRYADQWEIDMGRIAKAASNMGTTVAGAFAAVGMPVPQSAPASGTATSQAQGARTGTVAGGPVYTNCLIINGQVVAQGQDVNTLITKLTKEATRRNGGLPVNASPVF